jgi:hypothetical protein
MLLPAQIGYEFEVEGFDLALLHIGCFGLWDSELRRRGIRPE